NRSETQPLVRNDLERSTGSLLLAHGSVRYRIWSLSGQSGHTSSTNQARIMNMGLSSQATSTPPFPSPHPSQNTPATDSRRSALPSRASRRRRRRRANGGA